MTTPWYLEHGPSDGPLLLCLHGIGSCGSAFDAQASLAEATGRHLVAWDAPGYRHSPDPDQPFDLDDWADAAADLIDELSSDGTADVLGVSWGGVTATRLTLRHPEKVRNLILADSSTGSGTSPERAAAMRGRADSVDGSGLGDFARSRAPHLLTPEASAELCERVAVMMIDSVRQPSYRWACNSMADTDHGPRLSEIGARTLVIVGEHDEVTVPARSQELAAGIPNATMVTVPDAGHLANQQRPEIFNAAVAEFLTTT
ncbi:MAG: alpha/beta fold hydrolase [Acidimicrobiales bacterium]